MTVEHEKLLEKISNRCELDKSAAIKEDYVGAWQKEVQKNWEPPCILIDIYKCNKPVLKT